MTTIFELDCYDGCERYSLWRRVFSSEDAAKNFAAKHKNELFLTWTEWPLGVHSSRGCLSSGPLSDRHYIITPMILDDETSPA